ncbi:MAG: DUF5659 domain-containing protein [Candidatus Staskawiczbacteria bacterium]
MNENKNEENYLETNDIALVTSICYSGGNIENIDKSDPSRAKFLIKRNNKIDKIVRKYWSQSLLVEPSVFLNNLKEVKIKLYGKCK